MRRLRWLLPWLSSRAALSQLEGKRRGAGRAGLPNGDTNLPPGPAGRRLNNRLPGGRGVPRSRCLAKTGFCTCGRLRLSTACGKCLSEPRAGPRRLASWRPTPRSAQPLPAPLPHSSPARSHLHHPRLSQRPASRLHPGYLGRAGSGRGRSAHRVPFCRPCCGSGLRPFLGPPARDSRPVTSRARWRRPRLPRQTGRIRVRPLSPGRAGACPPRLSVTRGSRRNPRLKGRRSPGRPPARRALAHRRGRRLSGRCSGSGWIRRPACSR